MSVWVYPKRTINGPIAQLDTCLPDSVKLAHVEPKNFNKIGPVAQLDRATDF